MTKEAQRVAIAKACGWVTACGYDDSLTENVFHGACPSQGIEWGPCPDFCADLNAMASAEVVFDTLIHSGESPRYEYARQIYSIVARDDKDRQPFRATAAQRAECFLRTLNLWVTEPEVPPPSWSCASGPRLLMADCKRSLTRFLFALWLRLRVTQWSGAKGLRPSSLSWSD